MVLNIPNWLRIAAPIVMGALAVGGWVARAEIAVSDLNKHADATDAHINGLEQHENLHEVNESAMNQALRDLHDQLQVDLAQIRDDLHELRAQRETKK